MSSVGSNPTLSATESRVIASRRELPDAISSGILAPSVPDFALYVWFKNVIARLV